MVQDWFLSSWEVMLRDLIFQIVSTLRLDAQLRLVALSVLFNSWLGCWQHSRPLLHDSMIQLPTREDVLGCEARD